MSENPQANTPEETLSNHAVANLAPASGDVTDDVELPSGLSGCIRRWKLSDLRFLTNRQTLSRPGPVVDSTILKATWIETHSVGPYAFTGHPPWMAEVLAGDTTEAVRRGRMITWGDEYPVDFRCESRRCGARIPYDAKLSDMEVIPMSEEALAGYVNDNRFTWTFPECGKRLVYGLPTGKTQVLASKLVKQNGPIDEAVWASRTHSIEGASPSQFVKFYGDLSPVDVMALEKELERHDCGVRTKVDLVCPDFSCGLEQVQELRFASNFYRPQDGARDLLG